MTQSRDKKGSQTASMIAFVILVIALVVLVYRHSLFATHPAGKAVQVLAVLLMIWARLTLKWRSFQPMANPTQGDLITSGPYRFVRHPIYAAILYFLLAGIVFHLDLVNIILAALAVLALAIRIITEEHLLVEQYSGYQSYAACTRRVIPYIL